MKRAFVMWLGSGLFLGFCYLLSLIPTYGECGPVFAILTHVPFGWWHFLKRNVPQMTINWSTIGMGIICSVVILVVANWLLGALFMQVQKLTKSNMPLRSWRWRWTIWLYVGLWLLFLIAFGVAGIFTQTTWLAQNREPWYEEQTGSFFELHLAYDTMDQLLGENDWDLKAVQRSFVSRTNLMFPRDVFIEKYDAVFYHDNEKKVRAILIIPTKPQSANDGMFFLMSDSQRETRPLADLQKTIAELDQAYKISR